MADKFSETRKFFWRGMEFIRDYAKDGDKILDFGCGNGRLLELLTGKNTNYTGVDVSQKLIDIANDKYGADNIKFQKISSSGSLAFPDNYFNAIYSIAVFHHFPKVHAEKMAGELFRATKLGGHIVATVWNLWPASTRRDHSSTRLDSARLARGGQKKYFKNILKNWLDKMSGKSNLNWNDCYITFKNNQGETFYRYHHAFTKRELKKLFEEVGFKTEKCDLISGKNIIFIGKK